MYEFSEKCRICLNPWEDNFEGLFIDDEELGVQISKLGCLYEELFQLRITENNQHPQFICNYCNSQMKLFHTLKTKAIESYNVFVVNTFDSECSDEDEDDKPDIIELESEYSSDKLFTKNDDTKEEVESVDEGKKSCTSEMEQLYSEVERLHENNVELSEENSACTYPNNIDDTIWGNKDEETEDEQVEEHIRAFACVDCDETFLNKNQLSTHRRKEHKRILYPCTICNKKLYSEEALNVHMNVHFGLPAYKCEDCNKTFTRKTHYHFHQLGHMNVRNVLCHLCDKRFLNKSNLLIHMRVHRDERRYECDICKKRFRAYTHMKNHRYIHFDKKFECNICLQKYSTPTTLRTHINCVHYNLKPHSCDICEKKFKRRYVLMNHIKIHYKNKGLTNNMVV